MPFCLLLSTQRSGTNYFRSVIGRHPQINPLFGEIFDPNHYDDEELSFFRFLVAQAEIDPVNALPGQRSAVMQRYLDFLEAKIPGELIILDVKYTSIHHLAGYWPESPPAFYRFFIERQIPTLHLIRENMLETELSGLVALATDTFWVQPGTQTQQPKVEVATSTLLEVLKNRSNAIRAARFELDGRLPYLEVTYEATVRTDDAGLAQPNPREFQRVTEFLGVDDLIDLAPGTKKLLTKSKAELIANYDEVRSLLEGTEFSDMLAD